METSPTCLANVPDWMKENDLNEEYREIVASLPTKTAWLDREFHNYQGFWYTTRLLGSVMSIQKNFQAHDSDVQLATVPKAGTTWMKALIYAVMNRRRSGEAEKPQLLEKNPHSLVPFLEFDVFDQREGIDISIYESSRLFSTHLPISSLPESVKESNCKIVYMSRNPKDILVSLWQFSNTLKTDSMNSTSLEVAFDRFCEGETPFGPLWENMLGYWNLSLENPEKVLFLKFEEMKEKPKIYTTRLAEFLGCPFSDEEEKQGMVDAIVELCSFENLSKLEVNQKGEFPKGIKFNTFFRKGLAGDWKNHLTSEMVERIDRITTEKLSGSGLKL